MNPLCRRKIRTNPLSGGWFSSSWICKLFLSITLCFQTPLASSLASSRAFSDSPPIKRVAIIGTGIAGLSLSHALENSPHLAAMGDGAPIEATLFDSRPSLDVYEGSGIQINGGMSILRKINPEVQRAVANAALPLRKIQSRTKPWFNKDAPFDTLLELDIEESIRSVGGEVQEELIVDGELMCYTILRGALQEALLDTLPSEVTKRVQLSKTLVGIRGSEDGGITCEFEDGSSSSNFDLVVGCDGVLSAVKEYVETSKISEENKRDGRSAIYSGIKIRFAMQDDLSLSPSEAEGRIRQYFGNGLYAVSGVFGAGENRPPTKATFLVFLDEDYIGPFKKKEATSQGQVLENAKWKQDIVGKEERRNDMLEQVKDGEVPPIEVVPIIENSNRSFEIGVYFHNPFSLSGWSRQVKGSGGRFCTLAGDAAHAMPPFLGQGGNQAIQDSYCLARKIYEHNRLVAMESLDDSEDESEVQQDMKSLLKEYEQTRWAKTTEISLKAAFLGYLEAGKGFITKIRDIFFFTMGKTGVAKIVFLGAATPKV